MLLVRAGNPSEWTGATGNNTFLLTGAVPTLIDAGVGEPAHLAALEDALDGELLAAILITHSHRDHTAGIPALLARWPAAVVRTFFPDGREDGENIRAGDTVLRAVHTPGHAPDHFCFLDETTRDVYCGDLARVGGTVVIPASAGGDLQQYLHSLRRILALQPRRLLPGHGPIVADPAALIREYLQHRQHREGQIIDALRSGCRNIEEIVDRVYGAIAPALRRGAADSVRAHLNKLAREGQAVETGGEWRMPEG